MELRQERDQDLLTAYRNVIKQLGARACQMTRESLVDLAINSQAPRYYTTPEEAAEHINHIERRGTTGSKHRMKQRQYEAIYRKYIVLKEELKGVSKMDVIEEVVKQPAECFYMELSSACVLFWKLSSGKKKCNKTM